MTQFRSQTYNIVEHTTQIIYSCTSRTYIFVFPGCLNMNGIDGLRVQFLSSNPLSRVMNIDETGNRPFWQGILIDYKRSGQIKCIFSMIHLFIKPYELVRRLIQICSSKFLSKWKILKFLMLATTISQKR